MRKIVKIIIIGHFRNFLECFRRRQLLLNNLRASNLRHKCFSSVLTYCSEKKGYFLIFGRLFRDSPFRKKNISKVRKIIADQSYWKLTIFFHRVLEVKHTGLSRNMTKICVCLIWNNMYSSCCTLLCPRSSEKLQQGKFWWKLRSMFSQNTAFC